METGLRVRLRQIARAYPRWGWRKAYWLLRSDGLVVNRKRVRRYWADEGLTRPTRTRKKQRIGPQRGDRLSCGCRIGHPRRWPAVSLEVALGHDRPLWLCD
jgi:hypothetical protein